MNMAHQPRLRPLNITEKTNVLFHPGLLWKEWRQHRSLLGLLLLVIMLEPVFLPLYINVFFPDAVVGGNHLDVFGGVVNAIIQHGLSFMEVVAIIAAILLAAIMLGLERGRSLNYLASTAVSRRQILAAKWLIGSLGILVVMLCLSGYMITISTITPLSASIHELIFWSLRMTVVMLTVISLGLLSASIFSSVLYSAVFTGFFLVLPQFLAGIITYLLRKFQVLSLAQASMVNRLSDFLDITVYIGGDYGNWMNSAWFFGISTVILVIVNIISLLLAMKLFESSPLERAGETLLIGHSKEHGRRVLAILLGLPYATTLAGSWGWFFVYALLSVMAIYLGIGLIWRLAARLGLSKNTD